jgi:hypothetical protein
MELATGFTRRRIASALPVAALQRHLARHFNGGWRRRLGCRPFERAPLDQRPKLLKLRIDDAKIMADEKLRRETAHSSVRVDCLEKCAHHRRPLGRSRRADEAAAHVLDFAAEKDPTRI